MEYAHETHTLDNGLTVVLSADRSVPLVAVEVLYRVGSKHAPPGRSGLPHLLEHLFFQGSANVGRQAHFRYIQEAGGAANAATWFDCTTFYQVLPASGLDLALWLEADRMGFLDAALTPERLANQREVILRERRQKLEARPYGSATETLLGMWFPVGHGYAQGPTGDPDELAQVSLEEAIGFWRAWYGPANAVLVVCGDIDPRRTLDRIRRYFDDLEPRPSPRPFLVSPRTRSGEVRAVVAERVNASRIYQLYEAPPYGDPDHEVAGVLTSLLSQGLNARLQRRLIYELRVAANVACFTWPTVDVGLFFIICTALPGTDVDTLDGALEETLTELLRGGVEPEELEASLNWTRLSVVTQLGGLGRRADAFAHAAGLLGDAGRVNRSLARYDRVTATDLARVAGRILRAERRAVLHVVPAASADPDRNPAWRRRMSPGDGAIRTAGHG